MNAEEESLLITAATAGGVRAMYELSLQSDDPYEREYWLRQAAEKGYLPAMFR